MKETPLSLLVLVHGSQMLTAATVDSRMQSLFENIGYFGQTGETAATGPWRAVLRADQRLSIAALHV